MHLVVGEVPAEQDEDLLKREEENLQRLLREFVRTQDIIDQAFQRVNILRRQLGKDEFVRIP